MTNTAKKPSSTPPSTTSRTPTARELVAAKQQAVAPKTATVTDNRPYRDRYLDEISPSGLVGRRIKFVKGTFVTHDDDQEIPPDDELIALCDRTLVGWLKFNGENELPTQIMGLWFEDFEKPERETLGDMDQTKWEIGLSGAAEDPWLHANYLVLQHARTSELFTFVTTSPTGRRAVGALLRHFRYMCSAHPGTLPVVQLRAGGFQHRDPRVGWVATPTFVAVGRHPADGVAKPDAPMGDLLDDKIQF